MAKPRGPVYLTLPREVLAQPAPARREVPAQPVPTVPYPDPSAVDRIAAALAASRYPVIVTSSAGAEPGVAGLLEALSLDFGIGVAKDQAEKFCYVVLLCAWPRYVGKRQ